VDYKFHFHADLSQLTNLRAQFELIFDREGLFDDLTRKNILLALTELFVNVVKHGCAPVNSQISYEVHRTETGLQIKISDWGKSYDPFSLAPPDISQLPESGYGVYLVRSLMDLFEYQPKTRELPNITRISKFS